MIQISISEGPGAWRRKVCVAGNMWSNHPKAALVCIPWMNHNLTSDFRCHWCERQNLSILGLTLPLLSEDIANPIVPSYSRTTPDLYSQATTLLLQQVPILSILLYVEDKSCRNLNNLPSWVLDYTFRRPTHTLAGLWMRFGPGGTAGPSRIYNSSWASDMSAMSPQIHSSTLSLSGACFDAVVGLCIPIKATI